MPCGGCWRRQMRRRLLQGSDRDARTLGLAASGYKPVYNPPMLEKADRTVDCRRLVPRLYVASGGSLKRPDVGPVGVSGEVSPSAWGRTSPHGESGYSQDEVMAAVR